MNALQKVQAAQIAAAAIIAGFTHALADQPDVVTARKDALLAEIVGMKKDDAYAHLIGLIVALEAPKADHKVKTEDVARALLESPECACLTYSDIAELIVSNHLGEKTSTASISSYASKKKADWAIVERDRIKFSASDLLSAAKIVNG